MSEMSIFVSFRELSYNGLKDWNGDISTTLPSLESVDFVGNPLYFPKSNVLKLNNLKEIFGVKWNTECGECDIINTEFLLDRKNVV